MIKFCIAALMFVPVMLHSQQQTFILYNGITFEGSLQRITSDSAEIATLQHGVLKFSLDKVYLPNDLITKQEESKKIRFQAGLSLGLGATESGIIRNAGLETRLLYFPWTNQSSGFSVKSGYEAVSAYLPTIIVPAELGFQTALFRKKRGQLHIHGNAGYGFARLQNHERAWQQESVKGGFRCHFGLTWFHGFYNDASFYTGVNILFQNLSYEIESDWQQSSTMQRIQRLNLTFGVFL